MKKVLIALLMLLSMAAMAQDNAWEEKPAQTAGNQNPDQKYLAGAVPLADGHVMFEVTLKAPGKTARQVYDVMLKQMTYLTTEKNQVEPLQSRIVIADDEKLQVVGSYQEWMVFKSTALVLDRTRFNYHLIADCRDGECTLRLTRIIFIYDEERDPQTYTAEDWITDRYGLNKSQTKLARVSGKFRRKTIDRKDFLFEKFAEVLEK